MKGWNDPEVIKFMRSVTSGVSERGIVAPKEGKKPYKSKRKEGEDLTVDGYITKHGGIESSIDSKVYTSKTSYMEHIKANDCIIKDF